MTKLKKVSLALLALLCSTCLILGAGFFELFGGKSVKASAATYEVQSTDLNIDANHVLHGFAEGRVPSMETYKYFTLEIPEGVTEIAENAFNSESAESLDCSHMLSVKLPDTLTTIGNGAFAGCVNLLEVVIGTGNTALRNALEIGSDAYGCVAKYAKNVSTNKSMHYDEASKCWLVYDKLNEVTDDSGTVTEGAWVLYDYDGTDGTLNLPTIYAVHNGYLPGNYGIYDNAFKGANFNSVSGNTQVTYIGAYAFAENENLNEVWVSSSVKEIGSHAFSGSVNLTGSNLRIEQGVEIIGEFAFSGCTLLDKVTIPGSVLTIKQGAFRNCETLSSVEFATFTSTETDENGMPRTEPAKLESIGNNAFDGCALRVVTLPANVTEIGAGAFINNNGLSYVYLPDNANYINDEVDTPFFNTTYTKLVCNSSEAYDLNAAKPALSAHLSQLTYIIKVQGYAGSELAVTVEKLYNMSYAYEKVVTAADSGDAVNNDWVANSNVQLPVQAQFYSASVWYKSQTAAAETVEADKITVDYLTSELAKKVDEIKIYAPLTQARPENGASASWTYQGTPVVTFSAEALLRRFGYACTDGAVTLNSVKYLPVKATSGAEGTDVTEIKDAGTYTAVINLNEEKYGAWSTPATLTINVTPAYIDINNINWTAVLGGETLELKGQQLTYLYIYEESGREIPYLTAKETPAQEVKVVTKSYVYYKDAVVALAVADGGEFYRASAVTTTYANGNAVSEVKAAGSYKSSVTLTAGNNYMFTTSLSAAASTLGIDVEYSGNDRTVAVVSKTWYIVEVANMLVKTAGGNDEYSVADWTFGGGRAIAAPFLKTGATSNITFELYKDNEFISAFNYADFSNYVNGTMPVGAYLLKANVAEIDSGEAKIPAFSDEFEFNVIPASIVMPSMVDENVYEWQLTSSDLERYQVFDKALKVVEDLMGNKGIFVGKGTGPQKVTPSGYWSEYAADYYSDSYEVTFKFSSATSDYYYSANDSALWSQIVPGTFTVYYNISIANHLDLVQSSSVVRFFSITVYQLVAAPEIIGDFVYNNGVVKPDLEGSSLYAVKYDDNDTYINVGSHNVYFELYNGTNYRWADTEYVVEGKENILKLTYNIKMADNEETTQLYLQPWAYGSAPDNIVVVWGTSFGNMADYEFTLEDADGKVYEFNSTVEGKRFKDAPRGTYTLWARIAADPNGNYDKLESSITFEISQATNRWLEAPNIRRWAYGEFEQTSNNYNDQLISAVPAFGDNVIVQITRKATNALVYSGILTWVQGANGEYSYEYSIDTGTGKSFAETFLNAADGEYILNMSVQSTNNYSGLDSEVEFKIFPLGASSSNAWKSIPRIDSWKVGETASELDEGAAYHDGTRTVKYYVASDYDANGENATEIQKPTASGSYVVVVTVDPDEDAYNKLVAPIYFDVFAADDNTAYVALSVTMFVIAIAITVLAVVVVVMLNRRTKVK